MHWIPSPGRAPDHDEVRVAVAEVGAGGDPPAGVEVMLTNGLKEI